MTHDVWVLFGMSVCGVICAVIYDAFRGAHYVMKRHDAAVIVSDILYWIIAAAVIIGSLWYLNTGIIRGYEFAGLISGAVLYFCTVSRFVYKLFLTISVKCVKIIRGICKILLTLMSFLYKITIAPIERAFGFIRSKIKRKKICGGSDDEFEKQTP